MEGKVDWLVIACGRSASRLEEERQKSLQELEEVKKARQDTLEVIESGELERPSSR